MKKKFFIFLLSIFLLIPGIFLTACGENNNNNGGGEEPTRNIMNVYVTYSGTEYEIDPYNVNVVVYEENIIFNKVDFSVSVEYDNGSRETLAADDYTYEIYKNVIPPVEVAEGTALELGSYELRFSYRGMWASVMIEVVALNVDTDEGFTFSGVDESYEYTGNQIAPEPVVTYNGEVLVKDTDYTLEYDENVLNYGSVTITGIEPYFTGRHVISFEITNKVVDLTLPTSEQINLTYAPGVNHRAEGQFLKTMETNLESLEGVVSVEWSYSMNGPGEVDEVVDVGFYSVTATVTLAEGYDPLDGLASVTTYFDVSPADITKDAQGNDRVFNVDPVVYKNASYSSADFAGQISIPGLTYGTDYVFEDVSYSDEEYDCYAAHQASGKYGAFKILGQNNYTGTIYVPFEILPFTLDADHHPESSVQSGPFTYNGEAKTPSLAYANMHFGTTTDNLYEYNASTNPGGQYTLSYSNNVHAGTATITVTGRGNYTGSYTLTFEIEKQQVVIYDHETQLEFLDASLQESVNYLTYTGTNQINRVRMANLNPLFTARYVFYASTYEDFWDDIGGIYAGHWVYDTTTDAIINADRYKVRAYLSFANPDDADDYELVTTVGHDTNGLGANEFGYVEPGYGTFEIHQAIAVVDQTSLPNATYNGSVQLPTITLHATLDGVSTLLTLDTDYVVSYRNGTTNVVQDPKDAADYIVTIGKKDIEKNTYTGYTQVSEGEWNPSLKTAYTSNFVIMFDGYGYSEATVSYTIDKLQLSWDDARVVIPTVSREIWQNTRHLGDNGSITLQGVADVGNVEFALAGNDYLPTQISCTADNFELGAFAGNVFTAGNFEIVIADIVITNNTFATFSVNGTALTEAQIDEASFMLGDKLEVALTQEKIAAGYTINYDYAEYASAPAYYEWRKTGTSFTGANALTPGLEKVVQSQGENLTYNGDFAFGRVGNGNPYRVRISVSNSTDSYNHIANVTLAIFDEFTIGLPGNNDIYIQGPDSSYVLQLGDWSKFANGVEVAAGSRITLKLKSEYASMYSISTAGLGGDLGANGQLTIAYNNAQKGYIRITRNNGDTMKLTFINPDYIAQ